MEDEIKCCACGKNVILKFNKIGWSHTSRGWFCPGCIDNIQEYTRFNQPDDLNDVRKLT